MCVWTPVSPHLCGISWTFSLSFSFFGFSVLFWFVCFFFIYFYSPSDSLFPKERQKGVDSEGRGDGEKLREVGGLENITRKYCMKKNYFQRKKNKGKMGFLRQEETWGRKNEELLTQKHPRPTVLYVFSENPSGPWPLLMGPNSSHISELSIKEWVPPFSLVFSPSPMRWCSRKTSQCQALDHRLPSFQICEETNSHSLLNHPACYSTSGTQSK